MRAPRLRAMIRRMFRAGLLVSLLPSLAFAGNAPDVDEPDSLPPPKDPSQSVEPAPAPDPNAPATYRRSVTLEAAAGVGAVFVSDAALESGFGLAGIDLGLGGFVNQKIAITGRFAGVLTRGDDSVAAMTFGGAAQYWFDDKLWVGGGIGLAYVSSNGSQSQGFGLDLRAGYTFWQKQAHAVHASIEAQPLFISGEQVLAIAVLVGYQYL